MEKKLNKIKENKFCGNANNINIQKT